MKVAQRLFLGVAPSIIGLLTVASLAYWGRYAHAAPVLVVAAAAGATVVSLFVAWRNTRYVARRVERLASIRSSAGDSDELDAIEHRVESLGEVALAARADAARATEEAHKRADEYAALLSDASASLSVHLTEARLSLHVLQESHFGELNDNQEEMINAARAAVENAEAELKGLRSIADIDRGKTPVDAQLIKPGDVVRSLLPLLKSRGAKKNLRIMSEIEPALPRVRGDRAKLQDALNLILNDAVTYAVPGTSLSIHVSADKGVVTIVVNHGAPHSPTADLILGQRLISAQMGTMRIDGDATVVTIG